MNFRQIFHLAVETEKIVLSLNYIKKSHRSWYDEQYYISKNQIKSISSYEHGTKKALGFSESITVPIGFRHDSY